jgi:hypothetical protein
LNEADGVKAEMGITSAPDQAGRRFDGLEETYGALASAGDPSRGRKEYELALKEDPKSDARAAVAGLFEGKEKR